MVTFRFAMFTFISYVSCTVTQLVTDIRIYVILNIINITSQEYLTLIIAYPFKLFELFSKEVRVKKQPGMPL